jgi:Flp pilus assembly protein TadG
MRRHGSRGQTLVEFTITSSLMLLLLFAIIDFGRALFEYNQLAQAARLGARWAIVNTPLPPNDCATTGGTCQTAIISYLETKSGLDTSRMSPAPKVSFGPADGTCDTQPNAVKHTCYVNVKLNYSFNWLILQFLGAKTFTADSQMTLTSQYCATVTPCPRPTPQ